MEEVWENIIDYEGIYEISSFGRVRSYALDEICYKKPRINKGYYILGLWNKGKCKTVKIHRLVAIHFIPNPDNKPSINHKDGNKLNNRLDNLEWCTPQENSTHAAKFKLLPYGSQNSAAKINENDALKIREMYDSGQYTQDELSEIFNISQGVIGKIVKGLLWSHVEYHGSPSAKRTHCSKTSYTRPLRRKDNYWSKLTEEQVREMRRLYHDEGYSLTKLGKIYGITKQAVKSVVIRKTWKHLS